MKDLGTLITAMVTPFKENLEIDFNQVKKIANHLADNGSDGILVVGTTGESPTLTHDEKLQLFRTVKEAVGDRVAIIAGTGSNNTRDSIKMTQEAEEIGVDAILVVSPYYNKPPQEGLYQHFTAVAQSTKLPVIIYNIPGRTGVNIEPETMARLAQIPNVIADKEAAGKVGQCSDMVNATGAVETFERYRQAFVEGREVEHLPMEKRFAVYSGDDGLTLPMLSTGAVGVVSVASHIVGKQMKEMITKFYKGDIKGALDLHIKLTPVFKGLFTTTNPILVKSAMRMIGLDPGSLRPPMLRATAEQEKKLEKVLKEAGIIEKVGAC